MVDSVKGECRGFADAQRQMAFRHPFAFERSAYEAVKRKS
jgi:hypothetical protein